MIILYCNYKLWKGLKGEVKIGKTNIMEIEGKLFNLMKLKWVYRYILTYQVRIKIWGNVILDRN